MDDELRHCGHEDEEELKTPHECPYNADINNDSSDNCTCCLGCQQQCAWDI